MSRMSTSSASFSWARAAMRRACSSESKLRLSVEMVLADEGCDGRGDGAVRRLPCPDRRRRRPIRLDFEEMDALGPAQALEHGVEALAWETGPGPDGELGQLEDLVRLPPREEVAELVGAEDEQRLVELLGAEQLDRARVRIEAHVVVGKRGARELEPDVRGRMRRLVTRILRHEHEQ